MDHQPSKVDIDLKIPFYRSLFNFRSLRVPKAAGYLIFGLFALNMAQLVASSSLLFIINDAIDCVEEEKVVQDCENALLWGLSPTSVVFTFGLIVRVIEMGLFPVVGAAVDVTGRRRQRLLQYYSGFLVITAIKIGQTKSAWIFFVIAQRLGLTLYYLVIATHYAYFLDVRQDATTPLVVQLSSTVYSLGYLSQLLFILVVTVITSLLGLGIVGNGQVASATGVIWGALLLFLSYRLYPEVPARQSPAIEHWWKYGARKVRQTLSTLSPNLRWFFAAVIFADAAMQGTIALSFAVFVQHFSLEAPEMGLILVATSITMGCGAGSFSFWARKSDPLTAWRVSIAATALILLLGTLVFQRPDTEPVFLIAWTAVFGLPLGAYYAGKLACFATLTPSYQSAEYGGLLATCEIALSWLPLLVFNLLGVLDTPPNWNLLSLVVFQGIALVMLTRTGKYADMIRERDEHGAIAAEGDTHLGNSTRTPDS